MGQITNPAAPGITVLPVDRQTGPKAGVGNVGNQTLMLGANAGNNNAEANVIALGNGTAGGGIADAHLAGSVFVGVDSAGALTQTPFGNGPVIMIGYGNAPLAVAMEDSILIGADIAPSMSSPDSVLGKAYDLIAIGNRIYTGQTKAINESVLIGTGIMSYNGVGFYSEYGGLVVIGYEAVGNATGNGNFNTSVVIGSQAATNIADNSSAALVIIGQGSLQALHQDNESTYVGGAIANIGVAGVLGNNAMLGYGIGASGSFNTVIGAAAGNGVVWGQQNIAIGAGAGQAIAVGDSYIFDISTYINPTIRALLWGNMSNGNLLIGNSRANLDLDGIGCTNGVKIFNGTRGAGNPAGGGFFYVNGGALHWVDTGGNDTLLSPSVAGELAASAVGYTNNAGAQIATITNGPIAGNPTKWIPINDNGTIRNIPAW